VRVLEGLPSTELVSIGVNLHNAVESKSEVSFRQIHKPSGRRVIYQKVVQGLWPVENADIAKGYEVDADTYVLLDQKEIDAIKLESKRTIDLVQFVDAKDIDYRFFERPYLLVPADEMAGESYAVIRERRNGEASRICRKAIGHMLVGEERGFRAGGRTDR
jgi:DNA end-binding protein Ku